MKNIWRIWGIASIGIIVVLLVIGGIWIWQNSKDQVVAKVGEQNIYHSDWSELLQSRYGREILDDMINQMVVTKAASDLGIEIREEQIAQEIDRLKKDYETEEQFLEMMGMSMESLKEEVRFNLLLESIATHDIVLSEHELERFYEDNIDLYTEKEGIHLYQIVVETFEEADQIAAELNSGSDFAALASEQSIDVVTAENGGDLGWVSYEDPSIDVAVLEAADALTLGKISEPIPMYSGYAIIKIVERKERSTQPFDAVKDQIRRQLALSQVDSLTTVLLKLKHDQGIKIHKMFQES